MFRMRVLFDVINELYVFAIESLRALFRAPTLFSNTPSRVIELGAPPTRPAIELTAEQHEAPKTFHSVGTLLNNVARESFSAEKNVVMYVGTKEVPLYQKPTQEFDTCMTVLRYGDMVMVLAQQGRWAKVVHDEHLGWVLREDLVDRAAYVYPEFVIGAENDTDGENTIRIRAILGDMFGGAKVALPLQAGEYVTYRLKRKGLSIDWPAKRPRNPGVWHTILRGVRGIHMGIAPKTGAVMEFVFPDEIGHVAYVEAVFPDETIHISEANYPDRGMYNERIMTREEWRELRPVFIEVS